MREEITQSFKALQDKICNEIANCDGGASFKEDLWDRPDGGGGRTRILSAGNIIEKGGVNFSAVHGHLAQNISDALGLPSSDFYATGVSIVMHPNSPMMPIIHMNIRYLETTSSSGETTWWFGGGIDLTPHYVNISQAADFHRKLKALCDNFDQDYYPKFKEWADNYFYLKHRQETRGIGGIFFDKLNESGGKSRQELFDFVMAVGNSLAPIYTDLMTKNKSIPFQKEQKNWQELRRGRYVEFNLVWDKGTKFGLDTDGRTESILMSLPPLAQWIYDYQPEPSSEEAKTLQWLKKDIDWINK